MREQQPYDAAIETKFKRFGDVVDQLKDPFDDLLYEVGSVREFNNIDDTLSYIRIMKSVDVITFKIQQFRLENPESYFDRPVPVWEKDEQDEFTKEDTLQSLCDKMNSPILAVGMSYIQRPRNGDDDLEIFDYIAYAAYYLENLVGAYNEIFMTKSEVMHKIQLAAEALEDTIKLLATGREPNPAQGLADVSAYREEIDYFVKEYLRLVDIDARK